MLELLRSDIFFKDELDHPASGYAKWFQRIHTMRLCASYHDRKNFCEVGANDYLEILKQFPGDKYIIDPYDGLEGMGAAILPPDIPDRCEVFRCALGVDSGDIPGDLFDYVITVSVIKHIGQSETNFDCEPLDYRPKEQEEPRDAFCNELFRVMRPGGVTIHSIDHAPHNRSYLKNFTDAGFELLRNDELPSVDECLHDLSAVRQRHDWLDPAIPMPVEEMRLHSVLTMGFVKPQTERPA
ncbi:hypothetical protein MKK69_12960 [Methylobacterium sp. J-026]|uniref:hypothetical protein n=1 Tax=Methylobacterium sp. J-026 TaxID=2836624 RepID=UPI001FBA8316|nr:hypothetical protein [Methylobacterium sp. J-026]MCJ2134961.1 hypothetical protein [Methylobacterium sp. J-026]